MNLITSSDGPRCNQPTHVQHNNTKQHLALGTNSEIFDHNGGYKRFYGNSNGVDHLECLDHEDTYASNLFNLTQAKFVNPQVSDFHIQESSLAKDAGVALTTDHSIAQDFDGVIRVYRKDLGAYEYVEPATTTTPSTTTTTTTTGVPNTVMFDCEAAVESVCGISSKYWKMISCIYKAIKSQRGCESALALNEDKGIGHKCQMRPCIGEQINPIRKIVLGSMVGYVVGSRMQPILVVRLHSASLMALVRQQKQSGSAATTHTFMEMILSTVSKN